MSTEQLKALRDAAVVVHGKKKSADFIAICEHAIAWLEAAEKPKPCAEQAQRAFAPTDAESAAFRDLAQWQLRSAEQAQQPAQADVPSLMLPPPALSAVTHVAFETHEAARREAERQHAACVRIARERDEARRELEQERAKSGQYEAKLTALEEAVREELPEYDLDGEGEATADEVERIEYAGEDLRKAEAELAEARILALDQAHLVNCWRDCAQAMAMRSDALKAELAALKGQEPVGEVVDIGDADGDFTCAALKSPMPSLGAVLYAAPVPAPDSVPREQHEAEVAQARREGLREALELVERDRVSASLKSQDSRDAAWNALAMAADGIRALAEKGGKVGK